MADAEYTDGFKWGERASFDDVADSVAEQVANHLRQHDTESIFSLRMNAYNATMAAAAFGVLHKD